MPSVAGAVAAVVVALAIYLGSRGLRYFDAALVGYATATTAAAIPPARDGIQLREVGRTTWSS